MFKDNKEKKRRGEKKGNGEKKKGQERKKSGWREIKGVGAAEWLECKGVQR